MWHTCGSSVMGRETSKLAQKSGLDNNSDLNPNSAPTHIRGLPGKNQAFYLFIFLVDHTRSHGRKYYRFPYFILDTNSVMAEKATASL